MTNLLMIIIAGIVLLPLYIIMMAIVTYVYRKGVEAEANAED